MIDNILLGPDGRPHVYSDPSWDDVLREREDMVALRAENGRLREALRDIAGQKIGDECVRRARAVLVEEPANDLENLKKALSICEHEKATEEGAWSDECDRRQAEIDDLRANVERLTQERDEARARRDLWHRELSSALDHANKRCGEAFRQNGDLQASNNAYRERAQKAEQTIERVKEGLADIKKGMAY